jgi:3-phosphoshikimate 1-carboxyvinyltransferase
MKVTIYPSLLSGETDVPRSKSIAQRLLAFSLLSPQDTVITKFPDSADCKAALDVIRALGAVVTENGDVLDIRGGFPNNFQADIRHPKTLINVGESGLSARMFMPIAALWHEEITMEGHGTLLKRNMRTAEDWLPHLGAKVVLKDVQLPARIQGPLLGGKIHAEQVSSSQFVTGILIAGSATKRGVEIEIQQLPSRPYIQTTMAVAQLFGIEMTDTGSGYRVEGGQRYQALETPVAGDWSGAAFLFVAGALCADEGLLIKGLSETIPQADQAILQVLTLARVKWERCEDGYRVWTSRIKAFEFDATHCPDLFPVLSVLAVMGDGPSVIKGVSRLADKESNRGKAIQHEWSKMGINTVVRGDELKIYPKAIQPAHVHAHDDHRMAMALSVMAMAGATLTIHGAECVAKSFPNFYETIKKLGARVE